MTMTMDQDDGLNAGAQDGECLITGALHMAAAVRACVQELLRHGLLEASDKPVLYRGVLLHRNDIANVLGWLDLALRIDEVRGLAFLVVATAQESGSDEWAHPLVRRQRMTLEQSLLVAILRQKFIAHEMEAGAGASGAQVVLEELLPQLQAYLGDPGSDAQERKRLLALLEQLKGHGLVSDIDQQERVTIRPIIAHLANPESLVDLVHAMRKATGIVDADTPEESDE